MSANNNKEIKYLNKDFSQFRDNLINFSKNYFSNTYNDFNESDPGMMFIELASYVGDTLSFYIDKQLKESLLPYAEEKSNIYALAQTIGYKPKISIPSSTRLSVYQLLPSIGGATKTPDWNYALSIEPGMRTVSKENKIPFISYEGVDFSFSSSTDPTNISVYSLSGGQPEYYLLEKSVKAISGELVTATFTFTDPKKFQKVILNDSNIIGVYKITDADGNIWYEVPYLAQETIFEKIPNITSNSATTSQYAATVPYLLKLKKVSKRFTTRVTADDKLEIQFGAGISNNHDEEITPNPDNVGQGIPADIRSIDLDIDPSNFMYTKTYGEVPTNTTLTVQYLVGGGIQSNVAANTITGMSVLTATAKNATSDALFTVIKNSLACTNIEPATGGRSSETLEEIRQNSLATIPTQNRTVTLDDYAIRAYSMPSNLGGVAKVFVTQDSSLNVHDLRNKLYNPLALNFYCLGYDSNKNLISLNSAAKENLKIYLSEYKMLTDAINIKDAYIINFGITFEVVCLSNYNANDVLLNVMNSLRSYFDINNWQINEPIFRSKVYGIILGTAGVQSLNKLEFANLYGESKGYSSNYYDLKAAERNGIIYPSLDPCIFEIKYPNTDIVGRAVTA